MIVYALFYDRDLFDIYATQALARAAADKWYSGCHHPKDPEFIPWKGDDEYLSAPCWAISRIEVIGAPPEGRRLGQRSSETGGAHD